jgi:NADH:ubiquinone oxidoreductase subunit 5 (subunit L)/multisubunit Na+/H+ antiporter MnhA subunit
MAESAHELAPHHIPAFIPAADGSDPLMTVMLVVLIVGVVLLGTFYLHLHSLPERLAHKHGRMQFELVAILGLLALFTHNNVFWVAALLLAFIQLPDFTTPLETIASSLGKIAKRYETEGCDEKNDGSDATTAAVTPLEAVDAEQAGEIAETSAQGPSVGAAADTVKKDG